MKKLAGVDEVSNVTVSNRNINSGALNPLDHGQHVSSNQNFRFKDNMKAGYGIVFKEGSNHIDMGPSYTDNRNVSNLTINEYKM